MCVADIDDCAGITCSNGGTCEDAVNGVTCLCAEGYEGDLCQTGIGAFGCLQTNTALSQLCNISWVSAETSRRRAQCILPYFAPLTILFPNTEKF